MKKRAFIYKITNLTNNKSYIGITNYARPILRWKKHILISRNKELYLKNGSFRELHQDIIDLGIQSFSFEVLEECSKSIGFQREKHWIKFHNTFGEFGYNKTAGGRGFNGRKHSSETKKLLSEINRGRIAGEKNPRFGKPFTPEMKAKAAITREKNSHNKGKRNPMFGKKHSEETIAIMKEKAAQRDFQPEWILKRMKLSFQDVEDIRELYKNNTKVKDLALKYKVSIPCIYKVLKKRRRVDQES